MTLIPESKNKAVKKGARFHGEDALFLTIKHRCFLARRSGSHIRVYCLISPFRVELGLHDYETQFVSGLAMAAVTLAVTDG